MSKKVFIIDTLLNIIATAIPIVILQLVTLPIVGLKLGGDDYGLVVTLISLITILSVPFGNVLNNIRLLRNNEYQKDKITGDFNILLLGSIFVSSIIVVLGTIYYERSLNVSNIIFMFVITCINLLREYLIVSFRIQLNYKGIIVNNILLGLGYLLGTIIFYLNGYWQLIFIFGYAFSLIYIICNTNLLKEPIVRTKHFKKTTYYSGVLLISSMLKNLTVYADKLLLFPLLGSKAVSIYYTATIMGKIVSMVINPISSVILSYITKIDKIGFKKILQLVIGFNIIGIIGYFLSIIIGPYLLNFLYPKWAKDSLELLYITSATAIVGAISSIVNPFILRFANINFQIIINGTYLGVYIICALIFYYLFGLLGFCVGILLASVINLSFMLIILLFNNVKSERYSREIQ